MYCKTKAQLFHHHTMGLKFVKSILLCFLSKLADLCYCFCLHTPRLLISCQVRSPDMSHVLPQVPWMCCLSVLTHWGVGKISGRL